MSVWSSWVAPLVGAGVFILIPLLIAHMANTIVSRIILADMKAHERRLDKPVLPRKEEALQRIATEREWDRVDGYRKVRNACLLIALAVAEINLVNILLLFFRLGPALTLSIIAAAIIVFVYCARLARKERPRPEWVTTPDYYRNLAKGD